MTKKDYITIAKALRPFYQEQMDYQSSCGIIEDDDIIFLIISAITKQIKKDNQTFDSIKFLSYLRGK